MSLFLFGSFYVYNFAVTIVWVYKFPFPSRVLLYKLQLTEEINNICFSMVINLWFVLRAQFSILNDFHNLSPLEKRILLRKNSDLILFLC